MKMDRNASFSVAVLVMGASGIIAQLLLLRELLITFLSNELSIGIILANWLVLEATGSGLFGRSIERAEEFSWERTAEKTLSVYNEVMND